MSWMHTYRGIKFDLLNPQPSMVDPLDLVISLAHICRFTGHTGELYSVAQHSVLVSQLAENLANEKWGDDCQEHERIRLLAAKLGLMHDASEAYTNDLSRPLRHIEPLGSAFKAIEDKVRRAIFIKFNLQWPAQSDLWKLVKFADDCLLLTEGRDLMHGYHEWDLHDPDAYPVDTIRIESSTDAAYNFASRLNALGEWQGFLDKGDPLAGRGAWTVDY